MCASARHQTERRVEGGEGRGREGRWKGEGDTRGMVGTEAIFEHRTVAVAVTI
ncbi:unnamed protein product [Ectocarpus sp. 6 AP-2014]